VSGPLVVVGDVLLDRDVVGTVSRVCPDAPVPVLDERHSVDRPGGAGLAALFARGPGRDVVLVAALAADAAGDRLRDLLTEANVHVCPLSTDGATPEKIRLRADGQTLLRLDRGGPDGTPGGPSPAVLDAIASAGTILVSDYGRGVAAQPVVRRALAAAAGNVPMVWDPHPRGPEPVHGVRLATPNEAELRRLAGDHATDGLAAVAAAGQLLCQRWRAGAVAVTRGADGALLCRPGMAPIAVAPAAVAGDDTCGAGDRFAAAAAAALAAGALVPEAVRTAVDLASAYVGAGGASGWTGATAACPHDGPPGRRDSADSTDAEYVIARVRAAGGTAVATGGCFDLLHAGHLATLRAARQLGDCLIVCLNSDRSIARLKGPGRPVTPEADRRQLLAALDCVDAVVVFDEPTPQHVLARLRPDIWVKGGDYVGTRDLPEADLVRGWGGQTVLVPYLDGRSTTRTIAAARAGSGLLAEGQP